MKIRDIAGAEYTTRKISANHTGRNIGKHIHNGATKVSTLITGAAGSVSGVIGGIFDQLRGKELPRLIRKD